MTLDFEAVLIAQVVTDLKAAQLAGSDIFNDVIADTEEVPDQIYYTMPFGVVSVGEGTPDEEHPDDGEMNLFLDIYVRSYSDASQEELSDEKGLEAIKAYIREVYSYQAGLPYGAAMILTDTGSIVPITPKSQQGSRRKVWTRRITWRVVIG